MSIITNAFKNLLLTILGTYTAFTVNLAMANPTQLDWMAFGDFRGHIEPCGCNPATDMGGIERLRYYFATKPRPKYLFHLGNAFHLEWAVADTHIKTAIRAINPDASLVGKSEWLHRNKLKKENWILSNTRNSGKPRGFAQSQVLDPGVKVLGYFWDEEFAKDLLSPGPELQRRFTSVIGKKNWTRIVLLFRGPKKHLEWFLANKQFGSALIVAGNQTEWTVEPDGTERTEPGRLTLVDRSSVFVRQVPLGGQGILRALNSLKQPKPGASLLATPSGSSISRPEGTKLFSDLAEPTIWLDFNWKGDPKSNPHLKAYLDQKSREFESGLAARKKSLQTSDFVGSEACKGCHTKAYDVWKKSQHSDAFATLKDQDRHKNSSCIKCHVIGWDQPGGFVSETDSPHLKDVGCEVCHGARKQHLEDPGLKSAQNPQLDPKKVCLSCHKPPHTNGFEYGPFWEKIKH